MDFDLYVHKLLGLDSTLVGGSWFFLYLDGMWPLVMLLAHLGHILRHLPLYFVGATMLIPICQTLSLIPLKLASWEFHLVEILIYICGYGIALYVFICEWLMRRGATMLTKKFGDQWPKKMDYLALTLAVAGIFAMVTIGIAYIELASGPSTIGVILLTSALVLHLIRMRSEVNDWNQSDVGGQS
jgi:hypothetical protein